METAFQLDNFSFMLRVCRSDKGDYIMLLLVRTKVNMSHNNLTQVIRFGQSFSFESLIDNY